MFVVDTNILVYAAHDESERNAAACALVDGWREQPGVWYLTWPIVYEFLRVATHPQVFDPPRPLGEAWAFVEALLASPGLRLLVPTRQHQVVAARVLAEVPSLSGSILHDAHTAILMREHGIRIIYTLDRDFRRFPFVQAVNPFA